jgi:hypothetical protein
MSWMGRPPTDERRAPELLPPTPIAHPVPFAVLLPANCQSTAPAAGGRGKGGNRLRLGKFRAHAWPAKGGRAFEKITLFPGTMIDRIPFLQRTLKTVRACLAARHISLLPL